MTENVAVFQQAKDSADARQVTEMMQHARGAFVAFEDVYRGLRTFLEDMSDGIFSPTGRCVAHISTTPPPTWTSSVPSWRSPKLLAV